MGGFGTNNNASAANPTTAGTTAVSGTSSFGQTSTSPFSGFGLNQNTNQQSQPSSTNLFSSLSTPTQQQQQQSQAPTTSIFGTSNIFGQSQSTQPSSTGFGLGIPAQQQQQLQPQQYDLYSHLFQWSKPSTGIESVSNESFKFNDLPDSAKNALENVDAFIQKFVQISTELKTMKLGEEAEKTSKLLAEIVPITQGVANIIVSDEDVTQDLRSKVDDITRDEVTAIQIIDGLRDPNKSVNLQAHAGFPLEYYTKLTHRLIERLQTYKNTVDVCDRAETRFHERKSSALTTSYFGTLRAQHATFMALATRVAELEATLNKIRQVATAAWRAQTGSARNPFDPQFDLANPLNASIYGSR
ncbi:hypothetical protein BS47DRAFT_1361340 [Hydnum rufescens UP504]|uniref:Nucleoporin p58/p45 n=1 Tax=Hydnum rufescens UP504 TaxID=1448309 RepID=A0A9P6AZK6_9AGAM|nr:hypothetical protein BS47DRAFT_1361340 [Hydnum rufescens UP504]